MRPQVPVDPAARVDLESDGTVHEVATDLAYQRLFMVNVVFWGQVRAGDGRWVLIDAGLASTAATIRSAASDRFGADARPAAIVLTHGHFDHVGALQELAELWDVPVYAHPQEFAYLNGREPYPPPDPSVGGGLMSRLARFYPNDPIDVSRWLQALPDDGSVPSMPGWKWIHTPGHTPGHVALWRELDRALISGDAVITTNQESAYAVAVQATEIHGPPMYFTPDWYSAKRSVERLAELEPELIVAGHGRALAGAALRDGLHVLARDFDQIAVPEQYRTVAIS